MKKPRRNEQFSIALGLPLGVSNQTSAQPNSLLPKPCLLLEAVLVRKGSAGVLAKGNSPICRSISQPTCVFIKICTLPFKHKITVKKHKVTDA